MQIWEFEYKGQTFTINTGELPKVKGWFRVVTKGCYFDVKKIMWDDIDKQWVEGHGIPVDVDKILAWVKPISINHVLRAFAKKVNNGS